MKIYSIISTKINHVSSNAIVADEISNYAMSDIKIIHNFYGDLNLNVINNYIKSTESLPLIINSDLHYIDTDGLCLILWLQNTNQIYALIDSTSKAFIHIGRSIIITNILK